MSQGNSHGVGQNIGIITGRVIDAATGDPLPHARLYVEPAPPHKEVSGAAANGTTYASIGAISTAVTDSAGAYAIYGLEPGAYRLHVQQPGYRGSTVTVELDGGTANVTVGLEFRPVPLPMVEVRGEASQAYPRTISVEANARGARTTVVQSRQEEFLESDVRALTASDVTDAVTLAESDLFRALQRIPGVSRRDDYTAVLWTRGAPWVQTRVYFDGLPLYNPTHGGWLFSAVNPDGIGSASFHPGVRSASWGEGAAGILNLASRSGSRGEPINVTGELSLTSLRLGADGELPGGATWMLTGRRTYVDVLTKAWGSLGALEDAHVPYDFSDIIGRVDVPLVFGASVEASVIAESDRLRGDIPDFLEGNTARWGNRAQRATLRVPVGPLDFSATIGETRFSTLVTEERRYLPIDEDAATLPALDSRINHQRSSFRLDYGQPAAPFSFGVGVDLVRDSLTYDGPFVLTGEG
ncbi:MAG: carboxypeptidase regulatory-like domain-containing protein, partial [Gemmatimonadota bacterium]